MAYTTIDGKLVKVKKNAMGKKYLSRPPRLPEPRREPGLFPGRITYDEQPELAADKGEYGGSCNITRCQRPHSAYWYNHSTRKFYCRGCAWELNNDRFNKRDAQELYGHDLCTLWVPNGNDIKQLKDVLWTERYATVEDAWKSARLVAERAALGNAIDCFGRPDAQIACASKRWMQITVDMDQPAVKELLAYVEAQKDPEEGESPLFKVIYQVHIDPELLEDVIEDGVYLAAVGRDNGGDYGAIIFQGFDGRREDTEEAVLPIVVNDGLREKVKKREPITFTADFGVCAFT